MHPPGVFRNHKNTWSMCRNCQIQNTTLRFEQLSCFWSSAKYWVRFSFLFQWYRENLGMNCLPLHKAGSWHDTTAWKCPVQCQSWSLLLNIGLWLGLSFPLESEVTLSGPVWLTVHCRYNSTKGADADLISLPQIEKQHFWDGQRSMDFPSPRLSWMIPLSYTSEGEAPHK